MATATFISTSRSKSQTGFYTVKPFEIPNQINQTGNLWKCNHMYKTSYDQMSEKNVKKLNKKKFIKKNNKNFIKNIEKYLFFLMLKFKFH